MQRGMGGLMYQVVRATQHWVAAMLPTYMYQRFVRKGSFITRCTCCLLRAWVRQVVCQCVSVSTVQATPAYAVVEISCSCVCRRVRRVFGCSLPVLPNRERLLHLCEWLQRQRL